MITEGSQQPRVYSEEKMNELKDKYNVVGCLDEMFTSPPIVKEALKSYHAIHRVLVGTHETRNSLISRGLDDYLGQPRNNNGKVEGICIFFPGRRYLSKVSKYDNRPALQVDSVRRASCLYRSNEANQRTDLE